jgi:hypothetical protein
MARSLDQILTELNAVYQPQKDQYSSAITAVDPAQQAEEQGLNAAKTDAFSQIETAANRRGVFYGGMPIAEEQRYTGAQFLPSVANLRSKYAQQKFDLTNALNKVTSDEYNNANSIHQTELDREEKQREFDAQLAAQEEASRRAASAGAGFGVPSFGGLGGPSGGGSGGANASYSQKPGGGFAFTGANGQPVSAATYSQLTGIPFRSLLQSMANAGDAGAKAALGFVGNDYGYNPNMLGGNTGAYNALIWGAINPKTGKPLSQAAPYTPLRVNNSPTSGTIRL